jgi:predicted PurR-regulated permease PerM
MDTSLEHKAFLLLLALVTVAFCWLLIPFYGAVFWAVILAIIFHPMQAAFERRFGRGNLAAMLTMLVCIVIAIIPMALIFGALVNEGARLVQRIQSGAFDTSTLFRDAQAMLPDWVQRQLDRLGVDEDLEAMRDRFIGALQQVGQLLAAHALNLGQNTLRFIASVGIMLYVLFFLFRDGRAIGRNVRDSMPLTPEYNRALLVRFAAVVRATVKGNIMIATLQGTIGGVAFWLLGIQGALLWGALMVVLSLLPAVGAAIVWVPAAAYLFMTGSIGKGIILVAIGAGLIGLVDNLLRPVLVGKDTRMPDYVILVSTVGGLSLFGINGFIIGPLIAALFISAWTLFREERHRHHQAPAIAGRAAPPLERRR